MGQKTISSGKRNERNELATKLFEKLEGLREPNTQAFITNAKPFMDNATGGVTTQIGKWLNKIANDRNFEQVENWHDLIMNETVQMRHLIQTLLQNLELKEGSTKMKVLQNWSQSHADGVRDHYSSDGMASSSSDFMRELARKIFLLERGK